MAEYAKPEIIIPPDTLKSKVSVGGPNAVDLEALERAEQVIANMADSYLDWVEEDLKKISSAYERLVTENDDRGKDIEKVFGIAHDMKGQGGSFGYELITAVANNLCRLIDRFDGSVTPETQNGAIRIHIDAMKLIISSRMRGDGGQQGTAILNGVQEMVEKLVPTK